MNTKQIALIITFSALTIALDPFRIPALYLPGVYYRFCEIPIVVAFFLLGPRIGVAIAGINVFAEIILFPNSTAIVGRPVVFVLVLSMFLGIYLANHFMRGKVKHDLNLKLKLASYYAASGALLRTAVAPLIMYPFWRYVVPLLAGVPMTDARVMALMPAFMIYAFTFSLYTIPIGYFIATVVSRSLKFESYM